MITTLMQKTEAILAKYPKARDDDKYLALAVWWNYHKDDISSINNSFYIKLEDYYKLPSADFISRCRRKIQEAGKFLPTQWEVAHRRKINEDVWKTYMQTHI